MPTTADIARPVIAPVHVAGPAQVLLRRVVSRRAGRSAPHRGSDVGLLTLRLTTGGLLFGHATQNLFGWFGQSRRPSEVQEFRDLGYRPAAFFARFAGVAELVGSISLAVGAATPLGGALIAATSAQAIQSAKWQKGPWEQDGGYEHLLLLGASGTALAFTGPGRFSADGRMRADASGLIAGLAAVAAAAISLTLPHRLPGWRDRDESSTAHDDITTTLPTANDITSTHETELTQ